MRRVLKYIPILVCVMIILGLSFQSVQGTMQLSDHVREIVVRCLKGIGINTSGTWWNDSINFRKFGHIAEFLVLGLVVRIIVRNCRKSILICAIISIVDQTIKIFVPVRHFDVTDLIFDAIGYGLGILILELLLLNKNRQKL